MDVLAAMQTMTDASLETENTASGGSDLLRSLSGFSPTVEPKSFADSDAYARHLEEKFGMRVTAKYFKKDQESMDALGRSMSGNDLVIAPNILDEMAANSEKARYYEEKIQYWFDNIPKWKAESASHIVQAGARGYIIKPFTGLELQEAVDTFVKGYEK